MEREQDLDTIMDMLDGSDALTLPGHDEAIIGVIEDAKGIQVLHSRKKVIEILCDENGWTEEEAEEWYSYNILRSYGEGMPAFLIDDQE